MKVQTIKSTYTMQPLKQSSFISKTNFSPSIAFKASGDSFVISNNRPEQTDDNIIKIHTAKKMINGMANNKYFQIESTKRGYEIIYGTNAYTVPKNFIKQDLSSAWGEYNNDSFDMQVASSRGSGRYANGKINGTSFFMQYNGKNEISINNDYSGELMPVILYTFMAAKAAEVLSTRDDGEELSPEKIWRKNMETDTAFYGG